MLQSLSKPHNLSTDVDHRVVAISTRSAAHAPTEFPARSGSLKTADRQVGVTTRVIRGVVVLEVAGRLNDVVKELDRAIQLALAEGPRGVVCDLSVLEGAEPAAVDALATAGRHVRDWSGIPVAVACPDPRVREQLAAHHMGAHLIVTASVFSAVSMVLMTPTLVVESFRLALQPTAPRRSQDFVARTLQDWGLGRLVLATNLVVNELVTSAVMHATTDIELSIAWNRRTLRLTVRDNAPDLDHRRFSRFDLDRPRLSPLADLSRACGVLPTADGGRVVWAVLNALQPRELSSPRL